ncbi:hypothetical protein [Demequina sp.]|uniref:hypothetical protein n=1 Tax=Demequina sp. TaxID=2050685 RepID=UPI0025EF17B8|nr:hypothetical protein [Demequina sp.]
MTSGEDATRGGTVEDGTAAREASPHTADLPRRLPTFPFRGVNEGVEPLRESVETDELATVAAANPTFATTGVEDADGQAVTGVDRPRSAGMIITIALMTVLLIGAAALIAYLWRVSDAWEAQVEDVTGVSYGLGEELAAEREALATAQQSIELLTAQLAASKDSVSRLQAQNAQWGDDAALAQEQIGLLEGTITDATAVANSLSRCIEGHEQLVTYLKTPEDYDPTELESFETSVTDLCTAAKDAHLALQQSVAP